MGGEGGREKCVCVCVCVCVCQCVCVCVCVCVCECECVCYECVITCASYESWNFVAFNSFKSKLATVKITQ